MTGWKGVVTTWLKVGLAAAIGTYLTFGVDIFSLKTEDWKAIASAAITALLVFAYNWMNPKDERYGVGSD